MIGGVASATVLLIVGAVLQSVLPPAVRWGLVVVGLAVLVARHLGWVSFPMPENRRLVPETVFRLGRFVAPLQFGIEMGTGARTYVTSNLPYMLALMVALVADLGGGLLAGVGFGIGRALMTWGAGRMPHTSDWHAKWTQRSGLVGALLMMVFLGLSSVLGFIAV
ncbi:hypothetical protein [Nonomuraea basaltis]|uniref:hypothetical protein n=1 Tax=Nonomuraea basaltis TaxID=2495887 RepID=UPI00197F83D1|nr:hypothetical protein [Nonomuraea basaltis]